MKKTKRKQIGAVHVEDADEDVSFFQEFLVFTGRGQYTCVLASNININIQNTQQKRIGTNTSYILFCLRDSPAGATSTLNVPHISQKISNVPHIVQISCLETIIDFDGICRADANNAV